MSKDVWFLRRHKRSEQLQAKASMSHISCSSLNHLRPPRWANCCCPSSPTVKQNRRSLWYFFADSVARYPSARAIWSRAGEYTWQETHDHACRYARYFLSVGVQPGQLVAFYLQNSPEFMFAWLGLWAIGCAPALINYNLAGEALLHCLRVSGASVLLTDEEHGCQARIREVGDSIRGELGLDVRVLTQQLKREIRSLKAEVPGHEYRAGVKGDFPMCLFYTRYVTIAGS